MTQSILNDVQRFLVGGAVRDKLLGLPVHDRDWVVVGSTAQQMKNQGFIQVGQDFPVFLHPHNKEEYALARQERKSGAGHQGFHFDVRESVTLEQDLSRRDLTINAIAQNDQGDYIDPFNGRQDLKDKVLRHVSSAFVEDPLRVLRVARFHARFASLGFSVAAQTLDLMQQISAGCELTTLSAERIWLETRKALGEKNPEIYFKTLHEVGALQILLPEIAVLDGVPQSKKYHPEIDTFIHVMQCVAASAYLTDDVSIRFAVLLHDLGKGITPEELWPHHPEHEQRGLPLVNGVCSRLKVSRADQNLAVKVCAEHLHFHQCFDMQAMSLLKLLKRLNCFRQPDILEQWLIACEADRKGRGENQQAWRAALNEVLPNIRFFQAIFAAAQGITFQMLPKGLTGAAIGEALDLKRRDAIAQVIEHWPPADLA